MGTFIVATLLFAILPDVTTHSQGTSPAASTQASVRFGSLAQKYRITCHNGVMRRGGLLLDQLDVEQPGREPRTWESGAESAHGDAAERCPGRTARRSIGSQPLPRTPTTRPPPLPTRRPVLHRLNRTEYANAVRDRSICRLTTALLLGDDSSEGFDNIATVLVCLPPHAGACVSRGQDQPACDRRSDDQLRHDHLRRSRGLSQSENREACCSAPGDGGHPHVPARR
jgi:hypothetical protein